ncbi:MAG: Gfo/Idh/MocA family oxidoreductase [Eubacteriales bacterium]|nr:Gfo/Idh/MocA family oxidoreductase [Eubacteriales bacterium]
MKKIKVGIFGVGRGMDLAKDFMLLGADIAAICDFNKERLDAAAKKVGTDTAIYSDFDSFIEHGLDAVVLANYFHEHAPFAIKCFKKGIHVFSECISNGTMAEGIELLKAFEKSNSIYMLAENYPQMIFNREMKRVCDNGTLGKILYAEGEYNHPGDPNDVKFKKTYNYFPEHWRNFLPRSYYITHSLGPVMWATGATPKKVTSFAAFAPIEGDVPTASFSGDRVSIVTTQNDDGSIFRITGCAAFGGHHNAYRICGTEGQIENLRGMGNKVMLRYNGWSKPEGMDEVNLYEPKWNDPDEEIFKTSGHGGGDYLTARVFLDCIKKGKQPEHPFDIYSAINMSSVAILAHRSMLEGGKPYDIPDFTKEEDCKLYENDRLSPFYGVDGSDPVIPCCSHTDFKPTEKQIENYKKALGLK